MGNNAIMMELLGHNFEHYLNICKRKFSLKTTLIVLDQLLEIVINLHKNGYLHRNLKPENILMGINENKHL